ncbi:hypothetical protein BpHYR1_054048 [Brachionus plicatilis]|uniref:Uncharacterized protein n=1 Tax=Brachionus plicatilis TaxID=10195 RepID=A0A3M7RAF9_BRAPC|nr:hypothetical protein BpHYR1_054048 [Brachionus plicatilis]
MKNLRTTTGGQKKPLNFVLAFIEINNNNNQLNQASYRSQSRIICKSSFLSSDL